MQRYVTIRPRAWDSCTNNMSPRPSETVFESDPTPTQTGLYDQHGVPIYRVPDRVPLGFDLSVAKAGSKVAADA